MIERSGTCTALSVLIVLGATVILHRVDHTKSVEPPRPANEKLLDEPTPSVRESTNPRPDLTPDQQPTPKTKLRGKRPESQLTSSLEGETLETLARRIYGEGADLDKLWKLNRDQLPTFDSKVRAGMILRTPDL